MHEAAPPKILVIDDEPLIGNAVRRLLRGGAEVITCTTTAAALAALAGGAFDLVLCDVGASTRFGETFVETLRVECPSRVPRLVMMTGDARTPAARGFAETGFVVLEKPFDSSELLSIARDSKAATMPRTS